MPRENEFVLNAGGRTTGKPSFVAIVVLNFLESRINVFLETHIIFTNRKFDKIFLISPPEIHQSLWW